MSTSSAARAQSGPNCVLEVSHGTRDGSYAPGARCRRRAAASTPNGRICCRGRSSGRARSVGWGAKQRTSVPTREGYAAPAAALPSAARCTLRAAAPPSEWGRRCTRRQTRASRAAGAVGEDLVLITVEAVAVAATAAASLVVVRHRSSVAGTRWATVRDMERERKRGRVHWATVKRGFVERCGVLGALKWQRGRHGVAMWESAWPSSSATPRNRRSFMATSEPPFVVIK
jgi:hypothetical protein